MTNLSLPEGAEIVDGSIRFQATKRPEKTIRQLLGKPFTEEECEGVSHFLDGSLSLGATIQQYLPRFQNSVEINRLLVRIWMQARFGAQLAPALDRLSKSIEAEEDDWNTVFVEVYQQLETFRKRALEHNVRRPPTVERMKLNIEKSLGQRVYRFDVETQAKPIEHAAVSDRKDSILRGQIEDFRAMTDEAAVRKSSTAIEDFLLGRKSLQNAIDSLAAMPVGAPEGEEENHEQRELGAISDLTAAWMAVAYDLEWGPLRGYARWLLRAGVPPLEELFYGTVGRFAQIADLEEEYKLQHPTVVALLRYALEQLQPSQEQTTSLSNIKWKRFDGNTVPKEDRPEIAEKLMQALRDTEQ